MVLFASEAGDSASRASMVHMLARLIVTWNFQEGQERACLEFVANEFCPALVRLGVQVVDAWYVQAGDAPHITLVGTMATTGAAHALLAGPAFRSLRHQLEGYATHVGCRVTGNRPGTFGV